MKESTKRSKLRKRQPGSTKRPKIKLRKKKKSRK